MSNYKVLKPKAKPRTTLEQKIMILDHHHATQKSQAETVDFFKHQYSISTSSFSEWVRDEANLRQLYNGSNDFLRKSKRRLIFKYDKINEEMDRIVQDCLVKGKPINEPFLREHWVKLAQLHGVQDPKRLLTFSHGWLSQFKKRNGIDRQSRMKSEHVEQSSASNTAVNSIPDLQESDINDLISQQKFQSSNNSSFLNIENLNEDYLSLQTSLNNYENLVNSSGITLQQTQQRSPSTVSSNSSLVSKHHSSSPTSSISSNNEVNPKDVINEGDFELVLTKYGKDFLDLNKARFPESFKMWNRLMMMFIQEKEAYNDQKLRELLFQR